MQVRARIVTSGFTAWILALSAVKTSLSTCSQSTFHPEDLHVMDCEFTRGFLVKCQVQNLWCFHNFGGAQLNQRDGREPTPFFCSVLCPCLGHPERLGTFPEKLIQATFPSLDPRFQGRPLPAVCWTSSPECFPDSSGVPERILLPWRISC